MAREGQLSFSMATRVIWENVVGESFLFLLGKSRYNFSLAGVASKGLLCIIVMARSCTTHIKLIVMARAMCTGLVFA